MFENPEIRLDSLPSIDDVTWEVLSGRYAGELISAHALAVGLGLVAAFGGSALGLIEFGILLPLPALVYAGLHLAVVSLWAPLSLKRRGYAVREHDLLYRAGVLRRRLVAIPFNRIQHVETTSGVLGRLFGLATIVVYTAGGSGGDLRIRGLEEAHADRLRLYILRRAGQTDESG